MPREIFVTLTDIQDGKKLNTAECPVAIAYRRAGLPDARVFSDAITWATDSGRAEIDLPNSVREFVSCLDSGKGPVIPFKFHIDQARLIVREAS